MGNIVKKLKEIEQATRPQELAKIAYDTWVKFTPKDTGNARRRTKLKNDEIHADYAYALRLDQGWSKQFGGQGMTQPTLKEIQKYLKNDFKKR